MKTNLINATKLEKLVGALVGFQNKHKLSNGEFRFLLECQIDLMKNVELAQLYKQQEKTESSSQNSQNDTATFEKFLS